MLVTASCYFINLHCVKIVQIQRFFWSVFSSIRTEYGDLLRKCPYSVRIQENTDQKNVRFWTLFTQCLQPFNFREILRILSRQYCREDEFIFVMIIKSINETMFNDCLLFIVSVNC